MWHCGAFRARLYVWAGILAGGTGVESGSQKARPLTLAATHCVFLPATRARAIPPPPSYLPSFLPSFLATCRVSFLPLLRSREPPSCCRHSVARRRRIRVVIFAGENAKMTTPMNVPRSLCHDRSAVSISHPKALSFRSGYDRNWAGSRTVILAKSQVDVSRYFPFLFSILEYSYKGDIKL